MSWYKCDCGNEVLHIEEEIDKVSDDLSLVFLNISIWLQGHGDNRPSLRERLRHCWQILRTGKNYADEIILSWEEMNRLHADLGKIIVEATNNGGIKCVA